MAELGAYSGDVLLRAVTATFAVRRTHSLPAALPQPPSAWEASFRQQAQELELGYPNLQDGFRAASTFLNPVLQQAVQGKIWRSLDWQWR